MRNTFLEIHRSHYKWLASRCGFAEGTWPGVRRYVNMPGYNQPRQLEIRFTRWFGSGS